MSGRPPGWRRVFRLPLRPRDIERDVDDELAFHLAMRTERMRARGLAPDDANEEARRRFGDLDAVRRELIERDRDLVRRARVTDYLQDIMKDISFAIRGFRRAPGFAAAALLTLGLGIGAATAIFSVAYGVLLRPLPFTDPDRLVEISVDLSGTWAAFGTLSAPEYVDLSRQNRSFSSIGTWVPRDRTIGGDGKPERVTTAQVTASLFQTMDMRPAIGRVFTAEEDVPGGPLVIVLADALWRRRYGADPSIVGRAVEVDGVARTVVGVLPQGVGIRAAEAFTPMQLDLAALPGRGAHMLRVIGRLRPGVELAAAKSELRTFSERQSEEFATNYGKNGFTANARSLREAWYGSSTPLMKALLGTVILLLLLAAVNVANLLLVRAEARQREISVRVALGASRKRLVRLFLTESLLLSFIGALIGIPLATVAVRSLLAINPGVVPPGAEVSIDLTMLLAVVAVVVLAALVTGVAPAARAGTTDVREAIATGSAGGGKRGNRLRTFLVGSEVALAAAMLVGAGLVGRSFQRLFSVDPGFDMKGALAMSVALPRVRYDTSMKILSFQDRVLERLRAMPGVTASAAMTTLPLATGTIQWSVEVDGRPDVNRELSSPILVAATNDVFKALGISIVRGRAFDPTDVDGAPFVTVVSEAMVKEYWPNQDPIGQRIHPTGPDIPWMTVVGVARDVRPEALSEIPRSTYYVPNSQFARAVGFADASMSIVLRTLADPSSLITGARAAVAEIDPELALSNVQTLESVVERSVAQPRFAASVLAAFGLSAMVLAIVGVYGVLSYAMARRRRELAVRMALGAHPRQVGRLVMASGLKLAGTGVVIGIAGAAAGSRVIEALLYEVSPSDPLTLIDVAVVLIAAAAAASWVPARRATTVRPAEVLRGE